MKKRIVGLLVISLLSFNASYAQMKDKDINALLEKMATTENKTIKAGALGILNKNEIHTDNPDIEKLKDDIRDYGQGYKSKLEEKGYDFEECIDSLDILKEMSTDDRKTIIKSIENNNVDDIKEVLDKYDEKEETKVPSGSGGTTETKSEEVKNEETQVLNKIQFDDLKDHWAKEDIEFLANKGIINGQTDIVFSPDTNITRAQFVSLIVRLFELKQQDVFYGMKFKDINADDWYYDSVKIASEYNLVNGSDEHIFAPNDKVTREEMVTIILRAIEKQNIKNETQSNITIDKFEDKSDISAWSKQYIDKALQMNIINGVTDTKFCPKGDATRAQASVIIKRVYDLIK
ncbi:S-layer homology domain-containing protein [Tepidibacter mesophilus]|uniref:S-layer homology domain-containing protein n=1 Tax=Tepidibacter mesophilus TaxID=655607 RepID=UPI000C08D52B|nr:S-layer homology domain-containing protein [Tepidibacter mesophilus]